ncbi:uncharacterized protein LOC107492746 [Arachis duranensis]|uniref:Uncharacterized protein LOC107492746 n=1 Tax=Arachis duranensis TaxID=130453 RepID=A0A6P4DJH6_ARADU|nr:uncharacterized protein LOC107492746 [Arachis duranensis]
MNWQGVFVYGNPVFQKRRRLWQELTVNNGSREEPQAFLGDFNDILNQDEKVGLHPQPRIYLNTFKRFVDENLLMDIDLKGSRYTWYSNPRNNFVTRERLDRVLVNWKWLNIHQNAILKAAPAISSDHCALILETQPRDRIKKEFKFEAFWAEHEECEEVIRRSWEHQVENRNWWSQFNRNRSKCIRELTEWSRRKFKRADKELEKKKEELHQLQEGNMTDRDQIKEKKLKNQITELWKQEEKYWGQRSRLKWLKWGDKNTAFFHATTIQRRMRNRIDKLKNEAGHWIQGDRDIMRLVETHFTKLFTSEGDRNIEDCIREIPTRVTKEMNDELMGEIKDEEIKNAVFSTGRLKAPGPDGLNGLFFQKHWDILGKEVCGVVREIFEKGRLPEDIGETIVVLIPKVKQPENLNHLRPISCCNFIYKVVTKVLVGRLRRILDVIISPVQSAFIKGILIQDNIIVVQEVFHKLNRKGNNGGNDIAIKLDMNKAYDRLEWNFLQRVLEKFGFSREWVRLMMSCVKSATYRFKINGKLTAKIHPQRGLRQGDPLSPYLFILAAESFTILMEKALTNNLISGIKLAPTAPVLTHLLFADDCIIFAEAQEEEIYQVIQILNKYTEASGQRINIQKSGLIFGRQVSIQRRVNIEEITGMASWEEPGKYLGLPATWGRSKNKALEWIQEKSLDKMQGWKEKLLNQAGKEVLIKAVIQAIPVYTMNIIKFPKSFHRKIESAIAKFWWTNSGKDRSIHWKSWTSMTRNKLNGGLGFKDFECQNTALLAKQTWRLLKEEDAIWARILKAIYYPNSSLWEAGRGRNASWIWKSILEGRDFLRRKGRWSVGSGTGIDIWEDNWVIGIGKLKRIGETQHRKVSELIREGEGWDLQKIRDIFHGEELKLITRTPISLINKKDHLIWPYRNDGQYSVRSGYQAAKKEKDTKMETTQGKASTSHNLKEIWKRIWRLPVPKKVKMFLWKAVHGILPVNANLHQHRSIPTPICSICQEQEETTEHMLLLCPWTRAVWFGSNLQIVPKASNVRTFEQWLLTTMDKIRAETGNEHEKVLCNLGCICWCIWKARNKHIFQQTKLNPQQTIIQSQQIAAEHIIATKELNRDNNDITGRNGEKRRITWRPPPRSKVKINIDAAFHRETGIAASAAIIRDWQGNIITGITSKFKTISVLAAEAQAYREAIILTKNLQISNCIIESDCLPLVQAIKARTPLAEADAIIRDILLMLEEAPNVRATWTPREGNVLAHQLAAMAAGNQLQRRWAVSPPVQVRNIIRKEAGFANIHNKHHNQIQDNQISASTNLQQDRNDEPLQGRVESEAWVRLVAQGDRQPQLTFSLSPTNDSTMDNSVTPAKLEGRIQPRFLAGQNHDRHRSGSGGTTNTRSPLEGRIQ